MLGTRGLPARHGGFETAVAHIGEELVRRGWRVVVYCQGPSQGHDTYRGMELVHLPGRLGGAAGTVVFDAQAVAHASRHPDPCLTFGYNTAVLTARLRHRGIPTVINMDGIEWQRAKWNAIERRFLQWNERLATRVGDALIADHPEIRRHLAGVADDPSKLTTIAYGAKAVREADPAHVTALGLTPRRYLSVVARVVPENSLLEMVREFSRRPRGVDLAVVGDYSTGAYARAVVGAAGDEVRFVGPVYDEPRLQSLRLHSLAYLHGHTVGGTNPSLVEAMGAGNAVIAHDNRFNRWVAGRGALYFSDGGSLDEALSRVTHEPDLVALLSGRSRARHAQEFSWSRITDRYEELLLGLLSPDARPATVLSSAAS